METTRSSASGGEAKPADEGFGYQVFPADVPCPCSVRLNLRARIALALVVLLFLFVRLYEIGEPWVGYDGHNGALYSTVARNYLRFGLVETRFAPWLNTGLQEPKKPDYYLHHPVLLDLALAADYAILGIHEWSGRLLPISCSLGSMVCLFLLVRKLWGPYEALGAVFIMSIIPIEATHSRNVNHEAPALFLCLMCALFYLNWLATRKKRWYAGCCLAMFLGGLTAWQAYAVLPFVLGHYLVRGRKRVRSWSFPFLIFFSAALAAGLFLLHTRLTIGGFEEQLISFRRRAGLADQWHTSNRAVFWRQVSRMPLLFTYPLVAMSFLWLFGFLTALFRKRATWNDGLLISLFVFGTIPSIAIRQGVWIHEYWHYYYVPFFAISAATAGSVVWRETARFGKWVPAVVLTVVSLLYAHSAYPRIAYEHVEGIARYAPRAYLGMYLNSITQPDESVSFSWYESPHGQFPPTFFYLDRPYFCSTSLKELKRHVAGDACRYFVAPVLHTPVFAPDLEEFLSTRKSWEFMGYFFYDLKQPKEKVRIVPRPTFAQPVLFNENLRLVAAQLPKNVVRKGVIRSFIGRYIFGEPAHGLAEQAQIALSLYWQAVDDLDEGATIVVRIQARERKGQSQMASFKYPLLQGVPKLKSNQILKGDYREIIPPNFPTGFYDILVTVKGESEREEPDSDRTASEASQEAAAENNHGGQEPQYPDEQQDLSLSKHSPPTWVQIGSFRLTDR